MGGKIRYRHQLWVGESQTEAHIPLATCCRPDCLAIVCSKGVLDDLHVNWAYTWSEGRIRDGVLCWDALGKRWIYPSTARRNDAGSRCVVVNKDDESIRAPRRGREDCSQSCHDDTVGISNLWNRGDERL